MEPRPVTVHDAIALAKCERFAFNSQWQQSRFHTEASPAVRALIKNIHDGYALLRDALLKEEQADKDEDKRMALYASVLADPEADRDIDAI